jgi:GDP-D-mannose dehydratase
MTRVSAGLHLDLITRITNQDGSYLADFLLTQGYRVVGMVRRSSTEIYQRIKHLRGRSKFARGISWTDLPHRRSAFGPPVDVDLL